MTVKLNLPITVVPTQSSPTQAAPGQEHNLPFLPELPPGMDPSQLPTGDDFEVGTSPHEMPFLPELPPGMEPSQLPDKPSQSVMDTLLQPIQIDVELTAEEQAVEAARAVQQAIESALSHEFGASSTESLIGRVEADGEWLALHTLQPIEDIHYEVRGKLYQVIDDILEKHGLRDVPYEFVPTRGPSQIKEDQEAKHNAKVAVEKLNAELNGVVGHPLGEPQFISLIERFELDGARITVHTNDDYDSSSLAMTEGVTFAIEEALQRLGLGGVGFDFARDSVGLINPIQIDIPMTPEEAAIEAGQILDREINGVVGRPFGDLSTAALIDRVEVEGRDLRLYLHGSTAELSPEVSNKLMTLIEETLDRHNLANVPYLIMDATS